MQYTEQDLLKLVNEVEKEFTAHLAKAEENFAKLGDANGSTAPVTKVETLAKSEDGEKKPFEKKPEAKEKKDESKEPSHEEKEAPPAQEEKEAPETEGKPPFEGEKKPEQEMPAQAEHGQESHDYDDEDMEHMHKMYGSMSRGELKAHHDACRAALDSQGMEKPAGDMSMTKSEDIKTTGITVPTVTPFPEMDLLKSEVEAQKAKAESLQKSLDAVTAFITKLVDKKAAPQGKAITSLEAITKSESFTEEKVLTKGEITEILAKKTSEPSLKKSDRDAINAFYLNGTSIQTISHLLK